MSTAAQVSPAAAERAQVVKFKQPAKNVVRIGYGNVYVGNPKRAQAVNVALATQFHSWGWAEGQNIVAECRAHAATHHTLAAQNFADAKDSHDSLMMARTALDARHQSVTQVCDDAQPTKIAHDRTFAMYAYDAPWLGNAAVICHINIHPNVVVKATSARQPHVREFVESMQALAAMIDFAEAMGWYIVVTGDFNLTQGADKQFLTMYDIFEKHRMKVKTEHIDGMAWDRRLKLEDWATIPKSVTNSDHPFWIVADFSLN